MPFPTHYAKSRFLSLESHACHFLQSNIGHVPVHALCTMMLMCSEHGSSYTGGMTSMHAVNYKSIEATSILGHLYMLASENSLKVGDKL